MSRSILQQRADTFISEQGCAAAAGCSGRRAHSPNIHARRITPSLCSDLISDRDRAFCRSKIIAVNTSSGTRRQTRLAASRRRLVRLLNLLRRGRRPIGLLRRRRRPIGLLRRGWRPIGLLRLLRFRRDGGTRPGNRRLAVGPCWRETVLGRVLACGRYISWLLPPGAVTVGGVIGPGFAPLAMPFPPVPGGSPWPLGEVCAAGGFFGAGTAPGGF